MFGPGLVGEWSKGVGSLACGLIVMNFNLMSYQDLKTYTAPRRYQLTVAEWWLIDSPFFYAAALSGRVTRD